MYLKKSTVIQMDIHDFWMPDFILHTTVDIHIDMQAWISMQGHSAMDIRATSISVDEYPFL